MKFDVITGEIVRITESQKTGYNGKLGLVVYAGNGWLQVVPEGALGCLPITQWERVAVPTYTTPQKEMEFIYGAASVSRTEAAGRAGVGHGPGELQ